MAAWIYAAMLAVVVVPIGLGFGVGRWLERARRKRFGTRRGALAGAIVGVALVVGAFFEDALLAVNLEFSLPHGFDRAWIVLIDDASAPRSVGLGIADRTARVEVPPNGLLRLRDVSELEGRHVNARVAGGRTITEMVATDLPIGGRTHQVYMFPIGPESARDGGLGSLERHALVRRLVEMERGERDRRVGSTGRGMRSIDR